ncbi:hypothetical protein [Streptomyces sp. MNU103]|uniref:hypothetical protein n=1 Tax=Streptomyces sp. MNU103 TaxID=2560024 RepID=UPI001E595F4A|nr:hypothetical protein [Streptomyces sp. MNU103]
MATITVDTPTDAVREITRLAVQVIAADGHPGHSAPEVRERMEDPEVQALIRRSFLRNVAKGKTARQAFTATGQALIAHYCNSARIPAAA